MGSALRGGRAEAAWGRYTTEIKTGTVIDREDWKDRNRQVQFATRNAFPKLGNTYPGEH